MVGAEEAAAEVEVEAAAAVSKPEQAEEGAAVGVGVAAKEVLVDPMEEPKELAAGLVEAQAGAAMESKRAEAARLARPIRWNRLRRFDFGAPKCPTLRFLESACSPFRIDPK